MNRMKSVSVIGFLFSLLLVAGISFAAPAFNAQTSDKNMVRVDVTPTQLVDGKRATFEVRLNTHSVPLDYDLVEVGMLKDNRGRTYKAETWNGSRPGGHHRRGILEFSPLEGDPVSVTLTLKGIAGIPERNFQWKLK